MMSILDSRVLNVHPDPPDHRDRMFRHTMITPLARGELPSSVDYSGDSVGPVTDQGDTGSCVGQACASLRYWINWFKVGECQLFSARWIWMTAKEIDPWIPSVCFEYAGTRGRDALKAMQKYGCAREEFWPMERELPNPSAEEDIIADAQEYRIGQYWRLRSEKDMKQHLANIGPFVIGVPVYENWDRIGSDGIVPSPDGYELGGHELIVVGYNDMGLPFKNSWGTSWGNGGYGVIPWGYPIWDAWGTDG